MVLIMIPALVPSFYAIHRHYVDARPAALARRASGRRPVSTATA